MAAAVFVAARSAVGVRALVPMASRLTVASMSVHGLQLRPVTASLSTATKAAASGSDLVKELRNLTGAPLADCKKALAAEGVNGNMDAAIDWLRKKGVETAAKKAGRAAAEGVVSLAMDGHKAAVVVEVNSETDFVGRNAEFTDFANRIAASALHAMQPGTSVEAALAAPMTGGSNLPVSGAVTEMITKFRENIVVRRAVKVAVKDGVVVGYVHNTVAPNAGKIASVVALSTNAPVSGAALTELQALGKQLALHIVAGAPQYLSRDKVDTSALDRERAVLEEQARASGKPENVIQKMVEGRLRKFYEETVLLEQKCALDSDDRKVSDIVADVSKKIKMPVTVTEFVRMQCGQSS